MLLLCCPQTQGQIGNGRWGAKTWSLEKLAQRADFTVYAPDPGDDALKLRRCQVCWVKQHSVNKKLVSHLAACLWMQYGNKTIAVIETRRLPGVSAGESAFQIMLGNYFYTRDPAMRGLIDDGSSTVIAVEWAHADMAQMSEVIARLKPFRVSRRTAVPGARQEGRKGHKPR